MIGRRLDSLLLAVCGSVNALVEKGIKAFLDVGRAAHEAHEEVMAALGELIDSFRILTGRALRQEKELILKFFE